jgi:hypothetical protein
VPKSYTNVKVSSKPTNGRQLVMQSCTGDLRKEWMDFAEVQGLLSEKTIVVGTTRQIYHCKSPTLSLHDKELWFLA